MSHGDPAQPIDGHGCEARPLPGTAQRRMNVGIAAGHLYRTTLESDLDLTPGSLDGLLGASVGPAFLALLDACHIMLDC